MYHQWSFQIVDKKFAVFRFGYCDDLSLDWDQLVPRVTEKETNGSTSTCELTQSGLDFLSSVFEKHDQDNDQALSTQASPVTLFILMIRDTYLEWVNFTLIGTELPFLGQAIVMAQTFSVYFWFMIVLMALFNILGHSIVQYNMFVPLGITCPNLGK